MTGKPHALQRQALHRLHERLGKRGRGVVVMPCGSGKTLLGRWFAQQLGARLAVVFVPSLALVPQTLLAWRSDTSWHHQSMIVCSDPGSGRAVALDDLELPAWARASVTASTSERAIHAFLAGGGPARVIVSTYHSAPRVAAALQRAGVVADLIVCDEAHRLAGQPRREFRAVLDDDALPARRRVFLTATPVEAAAWTADADLDDVTAPLSLDDEALFGPTVYRATFADAVAAGRLVDYDVEVLAVRPGAGPADAPGAMHAVLAAIRDGGRRLLTFHSRVNHARELARHLDRLQLADGVRIQAEHLEARHGAHRRAAALTRLADPPPGNAAVLASARILTEGVDVPAVDTVVFAEPRTSPVDIVQAVGRAMRLAPGKERGRVVLAVTTGSGLDEDTELSSTAWRHVWITLRALASMDPRFAARLRARTTPGGIGGYRPGRGDQRYGPQLHVELPDGLDIDRWMLRALDRTGASWWHCYDLLVAHAREHGVARPSQQVRREGVALGAWVVRQRTLYKQGTLEPARVEALEKLPGWAWNAREVAWWRAAAAWKRRHSAARVSEFERWEWLRETPGWTGSAEPGARAYRSLAEFAVDTAARRRRGQLPGHLERAAEQLPCWRWGLVPDDDARMVDALAEYGAWKHDLNPPHDYHHDDGLPLGAWLTAVRRRRYTGRLHPALELELQLVGRHDWQPLRWEKAETAWRLGYLALRQYVTRAHTARVPYEHVEQLPDHELNLSRWCTVQRQSYRRGELAPDRVAALEQVPGWEWEVTVRPDLADRAVRDDVEHGHRWAYARGCRCDSCCDANADYERRRQSGEIATDLVDAGPAREHLQKLIARGAGQKPLARAAGVNPKSIINIAYGHVSRIDPERERRILALTVEAAQEHTGAGPHGGLVPAGPTWKLIDWMVMRGWPKAWISREIGHDGRALQLDRHRISKKNADAVAELDRRLGRTRRPPARAQRTPLPTLDQILAAEQAAS
jgi:superfamily II DNA or RNA helicase